MPRFGAHAFVWAGEWTPDSARLVIESAAKAGLDFVEIPLLRPDSFDAPGTRALLEANGIGATCSLGLPAEASLPEHPAAAEALLGRALRLAAEVGSPVLTGVTYGTLGALPGRAPSPDDLETVARSLRKVARSAAALGSRLGLEPVNRYETHLLNRAVDTLDMLERIGEPNVFLHLDTYHMNIEEKGFKAPILQAGSRLAYIHLSESDRGTPGTGNVHWQDVFDGLAEIGYQGDMVLESFVALNPDIARATCIWRPVAPSPDVLIRDGLSFLRGLARSRGLS